MVIIARMKIAVTGFANSGKTTLFNALTGQSLDTPPYPATQGEPHAGTVKVPDARVDTLYEHYKSRKLTYASVLYADHIGLVKGDSKQNRKVMDHIQDADAVLHVVRAFQDAAVAHPLGNVEPLRDIADFEAELILGDLGLVEKRLERMEKESRKGKTHALPREKEALLKCKDALEAERPLRSAELGDDELGAVSHLQFLSLKPEIIVLNTADDGGGTKGVLEEAAKRFGDETTRVLSLPAKIEMELTELNPEEALEFLEALGIQEPASGRLIRLSYGLLGLISFFTVGEDEVKAWTINNDTPALKAAGKIHSDIERGFIRAEVISYDDFIKAGSMAAARSQGTLRLEGKTYSVKDGDIINFRFNV